MKTLITLLAYVTLLLAFLLSFVVVPLLRTFVERFEVINNVLGASIRLVQ
jgi:F0F1-type ATP synthase membrane subunit b/b'